MENRIKYECVNLCLKVFEDTAGNLLVVKDFDSYELFYFLFFKGRGWSWIYFTVAINLIRYLF